MSDLTIMARQLGSGARGAGAVVGSAIGALFSRMKEEHYHRSLRKRGETEAKVSSLLEGQQLTTYEGILRAIAYDLALAGDDSRPVAERQKAMGRVAGNRAMRERIEKQTLKLLKPRRDAALPGLMESPQSERQRFDEDATDQPDRWERRRAGPRTRARDEPDEEEGILPLF